MTKKLLRLLRIAPLALLFAGIASAQTTGTIIGVVTDASTGKPVAGAVVIASSPNLQGEQTAVTDGNGNYRFVQLPPGEYKLAVQLEGFKPFERSDIIVRVDKTIRTPLSVIPDAVQMEEQVVRTGAAPVVNVGSAESGAVVSQEFMANVPVGRSFEQIAAVVPTAVVGVVGVGFAGAQGVENQYIVDGLNTTDPAYGGRAGDGGDNGPPSLRPNFVQELDIKTGGFGAEYGRATGGVMNVVLKSGTNEYHGSVFSSYAPDFLVSPDGETIGASGEAIAYKSKPDEGAYALDFGGEIGGPILKDKLWFYAGFAPVIQVDTYQRFLRQNVTPGNANNSGACPEGSTLHAVSDGGYGECVDSNNDALQTTIPGSARDIETKRTTYQWLGKLTYLLDENHSFSVTGWGAPSDRNFLGGGFFAGGTLSTARSNELQYEDQGQTALFARYGGKYLDKRLVTEVQTGWYRYYVNPVEKTRAGVDQLGSPSVEWLYEDDQEFQITDFESVASGYCRRDPDTGVPLDTAECPVNGYTTGGAGFAQDYTTDRYVARASASYLLEGLAGQHNFKAGIDLERVEYEVSNEYTGGAYYLYTAGLFTAFRGFGTIQDPQTGPGGVPGLEISDAASDPSRVNRIKSSNTSETDSFAYYLQDSWQPSFFPNFTLNAGIRLETQSMENQDVKDSTGFDINDNWSPRVQAIWDFTGTGRGKVAGTWGRFYYAMPLDMGNRAFGSEVSLRYNLDASTCGFSGTNPGGFDTRQVEYQFNYGTGFRSSSCQLLTRTGANNDLRLTGSVTPADDDLKGQYVDQFGAQVEYEVLPDLAVRIDYQGRRQGHVIEDMSSNDGGDYFIGNPGRDRDIRYQDGSIAGNSKFVETTDPNTGKTVTIEFPDPERSYDGVTFSATKLFSKGWLAQASYTYSALRGNYSGPFYPEYGQLDPGITGEYDLASLMGNKKGFLPGDQTHQVKLYGAYNWNFGPRLRAGASAAYTGFSGTPVSALGAHPDYGSSSSFIIPRGQAGRTPFVHTVDVGASMGYVIRAPYAVNFRVDLFNVFNSQEILQYDQDYTFDTVTPISGIDCDSRDAAGKSDPIASLKADCPGLAYAKTVDGHVVTTNPNFGKAGRTNSAYQVPLSMRFSLALQF